MTSTSSRRSAPRSGAGTRRRASSGTSTRRRCWDGRSSSCSGGPGSTRARVDNAIAGCVYQIGEQSTGITRNAWLGRGLAEETGAITVDIRCGSGQEATHFGALRIAAGVDDLVVTGGVESMSRVGFPVNERQQEEFGRGFDQELLDRYELLPQGLAAELIAERWGISREASDEFAARSQQRATAASESGAFRRETMDFEVDGEVHSVDQGIRPGTTAEKLAGAEAGLQGGRDADRRQLLADLRRGGGAAARE